ncbi:MAG: MaoC family dehydratase [Halovenus sp.]
MSTNWYGNPLLDRWAETSTQFVESALTVNRAAVEVWSRPQSGSEEATVEPSIDQIEPAAELPEWHSETSADDPTELTVGDYFEFTKTITDADIRRFAAASGDTNPLHLDEEFAEQTRFRGRIAHGTLVGGLISAALARIPGLVIYLSQDLEFHNPVRVDDRVTAECEIIEDLGNNQYRLQTRVLDDEETVIDGEAVVLVEEIAEDD